MLTKVCAHGGVYSVNPKLVKLDFSSNVNPLGISEKVLELIHDNITSLSKEYPDPKCKDLKRSLSNYVGTGIHPDSINVGNGATELIHDFARTFVRKKVVIPVPTFCEYESACRRMGANVVLVPMQDFKLAPDIIIENANNSDAVFLCNPNNPTGWLESKSIKKIIEGVDNSTRILIDECFIEFVDGTYPSHSMIEKTHEFDNIMILRSLTKSFGLAGLRIGYSISNNAAANRISASQIPWNVNGIAQRAGISALENMTHLEDARRLIKKEREFMQTHITKRLHSFIPLRSDVNYFLIRLEAKDSTSLRDSILLRKGILVRDCSDFAGIEEDYIRVAVKTHQENLLLLDALENSDR
jgi:threonine-phosphate decarboxylase